MAQLGSTIYQTYFQISTSELFSQLQVHGTVNCYIICDDGVVIGTDSRTTIAVLKNYKDQSILNEMKAADIYFTLINSDNEPKYKELTLNDGTRVGLTGCGRRARKNHVWEYCEGLVKEKNLSVDALVGAVPWVIKEYEPQNEKDKFCLYIVGYSVSKKAYVVHFMGDDYEDKTYTSFDVDLNQDPELHPHYGAIGSGDSFALQQLESLVTPHMKYEKAMIAINRALVFSSRKEITCVGGN